jgi:hypothetical protein
MVEITKDEFGRYEMVRESGVTNMFMVTTVCRLSGLSKEKVIAIMEQYNELVLKYPGVRSDD